MLVYIRGCALYTHVREPYMFTVRLRVRSHVYSRVLSLQMHWANNLDAGHGRHLSAKVEIKIRVIKVLQRHKSTTLFLFKINDTNFQIISISIIINKLLFLRFN